MPIEPPNTTRKTDDEQSYLQDERWLLVQRVLASAGLQRAAQLRHILEYITKAALLNPSVPLREYEIACEVLGRRSDFDPTTDNIVRSQVSSLRRRLDTYFTEEAPGELLRITIPKGAYLPHFEKVTAPEPLVADTSSLPADLGPTDSSESRVQVWPHTAILLTVALATLVLTLAATRLYRGQVRSSTALEAQKSNAFVQLLRQKGTEVTIVLPDLSLLLMQVVLDTNISVQEYSNSVIGSKITEQDPTVRRVLEQIRDRRLTSVNEAMIAQDLKDTLARNGVTATVRFARDMRTHDFGEGNFILIGSRRSNPWTELFSSQTNFRFSEGISDRNFAYRNLAPNAGESSEYYPYQKSGGKISSYADIAFISNLTHSGYALLINGSDYSANEAAARYLLHGRLREDLSELMQHRDVTYFEVLLGGSHIDNDAEEEFEPVAIRPLGLH